MEKDRERYRTGDREKSSETDFAVTRQVLTDPQAKHYVDCGVILRHNKSVIVNHKITQYLITIMCCYYYHWRSDGERVL